METNILKELVYKTIECIAKAEDENQVNRLQSILDLLIELRGRE